MTTGLKEIQQLAVRNVPVLKVGQTVRVHLKVKEGEKERVQIFEGLIIKINSGTGADKTFTVRKLVQGIGVEKNLSLYSPLIVKIEVKKEAKVRRAKLYYMRERFGKSARLKEGFVSEQEMEQSIEELASVKAKEEAANDVKVEADNPEEPAVRTEEAPEEEKK